jgi:hypothetical protein
MRIALILPLLSLAGCSPGSPAGPPPGLLAGAGKDRLCIAGAGEGARAGVIAYAADGAANCSLSGTLQSRDGHLTLTPKGEGACQIPLTLAGDQIRIGNVPASCSYYCGPGATIGGKRFTRDAKATPAVDLAGDALC